MLRKWAQKKAVEIEARNWAAVAGFVDRSETPIDYVATRRHFADEVGLGHTYVTDRQLIITAGPPPLEVLPLPWAEIRVYPISERAAVVEVPTDGNDEPFARLTIECAPGSDPLWKRLWPEITARAAEASAPSTSSARSLLSNWIGGARDLGRVRSHSRHAGFERSES